MFNSSCVRVKEQIKPTLKEDPTESVDLSMCRVEVEKFKNFTKEWEVLGKSILHSTRYESLCSCPPK